jgi:hypothetical protein
LSINEKENIVKKILFVFLVILLAPISSFGGTPIEQDATINCSFDEEKITLEGLAITVSAYGHSCDSISSVSKMIFSDGFILVCNNFTDKYDIKNRSGHWYVTVD